MTKSGSADRTQHKKAAVDSESSSPVNTMLGARMRQVRMLAGITQQALAQNIGVTVQQIQKYESGSNRISAARLLRMAEIVGVPISVFFQGISSSSQVSNEGGTSTTPHAAGDAELELEHRHEIELVRSFRRIRDEEVRQWALNLLRTLANRPENGAD